MFEVHQPNLENMQQYLSQESQKNSGGSSINWWSIPSGMSSVRILPPWDPTGRVALPVYMHPIEYQGEGMSYKKYNWTCVSKTFNKECPICSGLVEMSSSGIDVSAWEASRRQFYFNAIIMHDPTYNQQKKTGVAPGTHVLMKAPKTFYDWIIAQITNPMIGDITSVSTGIDVYLTKEGTGLGTSYSMTLSPNGRTQIPKEYLDNVKELYNLDDVFSAGFDQKQVDELVTHLKKSAGVMVNSIPNAVNQMAGYTTTPNFRPEVQQVIPSQFIASTNMAQPAANPYNAAAQIPSMPVPAPAPVAPVPNNLYAQNDHPEIQSNKPKCYGQYDNGNVNCVVCPFEIPCSQGK